MELLGRTRRVCDRVIHVASCGSTNDVARDYIADLRFDATGVEPSVCVVVADQQTEGRGRLGRTWVSGTKDALLASFVFALPSSVICEAGGLVALEAGVCVLDALRTVIESPDMQARLSLKWPNDVYCGEAKLAGILAETLPAEQGRVVLILGIGINVLTNYDYLPSLNATSLYQQVSDLPPFEELRDLLCAAIAVQLLERFAHLIREPQQEKVELLARANDESMLRGRCVCVTISEAHCEKGLAGLIQSDGSLELIHTDGSVLPVYSGEVVQVRAAHE